jgi:hypothetical protein
MVTQDEQLTSCDAVGVIEARQVLPHHTLDPAQLIEESEL